MASGVQSLGMTLSAGRSMLGGGIFSEPVDRIDLGLVEEIDIGRSVGSKSSSPDVSDDEGQNEEGSVSQTLAGICGSVLQNLPGASSRAEASQRERLERVEAGDLHPG